MGKSERLLTDLKPFNTDTLLDRDMIIQMLKYEDSLILGEVGNQIYTNPTYEVSKSLFSEYVIHRLVLDHFGYDTTDESLEFYRKIFKTYYKSPTEYDKEVLQSVAYMRENRCVYFVQPVINVGDVSSDCKLYTIDGEETTIKESLGEFNVAFNVAFIAGFSNS